MARKYVNVSDLPVQIDGLWALAFGNGGTGGPTGTLYFTAGLYGEGHGIFGHHYPASGYVTDLLAELQQLEEGASPPRFLALADVKLAGC